MADISLTLPEDGSVAANAAIVVECYGGAFEAVVSAGGREIPTVVTSHSEARQFPQASYHSLVRPVAGDWPTGTLEIHARLVDDRTEIHQSVLIRPAIVRVPPSCSYVRAPMLRECMPGPMMPGREDVVVDLGPITAAHGPYATCAIEYAPHDAKYAPVRQEFFVALDRPQTIHLDPPLPRALTLVVITDLTGASLVLSPPFPVGTPPPPPPFA